MNRLIIKPVGETGFIRISFEADGVGGVAFTRSHFRELRSLLEKLYKSKDCQGILISVGNEHRDSTGYPVEELLDMDQVEVRRFCFEAQDTLKLLMSLEIPTFCLMTGSIDGPALELALACDRRIMSLSEGSRIHFPELSLGLIPPFGGAFSLIKRLDLPRVLELIETCGSLSATQALELDLVDHLGRADVLEPAAVLISRQDEHMMKQTEGNGTESLLSLLARVWSENRVRKLLQIFMASRRARKSLKPGVLEAYLGFLNMVREGLSSGLEEGLMVAARNFTELLSSQPNRNLLSLYSRTRRLKQWVKSIALESREKGKVVTIIGGSRRTVEWGARFASKGFTVRLVTEDREELSRILREQLGGREEASRRIFHTTHADGLATSGLVIIASRKARIEEVGECAMNVIAGMPSTIDLLIDTEHLPCLVSEIPLRSRHRVYGVSSSGTVGDRGVIEISLCDRMQEEGLPELLSFFDTLDLLTIVIRETPAGLCKRVLTAYITEALRLVEEGAGILRVEEVAFSSGMSSGPFWGLDALGLETYLETTGLLKVRNGERFDPPDVAVRFRESGIEGKHGEKGFYVYTDGSPWLDESILPAEGGGMNSPRYDDVIKDRLFYSVVGEAIRVYGEGIAAHPEVVDCAIDSLGIFPSHLGGPLYFASMQGSTQLVHRFEKMYRAWGVQFEPPEFLYSALGNRARSPFKSRQKI